ncbi:hypothetical protein R5R35_005212 [Gryllus longicercus]|uniref:Uncharacterized protein n=1 Tax=Gryllus longicercus TaxID=2509291 RepID=A0AAN9VIF3_9ORTH
MLKGLEPDMKIVMDAQRWFPGAGWKTFYPLEETDICENACEHFPEFMSGVFEAMGLTVDKENLANTCPIPAVCIIHINVFIISYYLNSRH